MSYLKKVFSGKELLKNFKNLDSKLFSSSKPGFIDININKGIDANGLKGGLRK